MWDGRERGTGEISEMMAGGSWDGELVHHTGTCDGRGKLVEWYGTQYPVYTGK